MIVRDAIVRQLHGDHAMLEIRRRNNACGPCEKGQGCGASLLHSRVQQSGLLRVKSDGLTQGQSVKVLADEASINRAALSLYGWPLVGMIFGAGLFSVVSGASLPTDLAALLGAIAGLAGGLYKASGTAHADVTVISDET